MRRKINIFLLIVFLIVPIYVYASKGNISNESKSCLGCHSNKALTKQLENKEQMSLFVNGIEFSNSIHSSIDCSGCHKDINVKEHPKAVKIKSRKEYSESKSKVCVSCHAGEQTSKYPVHGYIVNSSKISCSQCHSPHSIMKMSEWKDSVNEIEYCIYCHRYSLGMSLMNKEYLSLQVKRSDLAMSVHKNLICSVCHMGFSKTSHPVRTFKSKSEFSVNAHKACIKCHTEAQLRKSPVHGTIIGKGTCVECHGAHLIKSIAAQKAVTKEDVYCLSCHKSKITMRMKNGEVLYAFVDEMSFRNSVHGKLKCNECHREFSKALHPVRSFGSRVEYSMFSSNLCKKCHESASKKYEESVHNAKLKSGNFKAPTCVSCHGSHNIVKATVNPSIGIVTCSNCHQDMKDSYEASIHYKAYKEGKKNTPNCSACHRAHDIEGVKMSNKIKDSCLNCHVDVARIHTKWLSNPPITLSTFPKAHFEKVSCVACHVELKEGSRGVYLTLYNTKSAKPLTDEEIANSLQVDIREVKSKLDLDGDNYIGSYEMWNVFKELYKKKIYVTFKGVINVTDGETAHRITSKATAVKQCEKCHHPNAEFFKNVDVVIAKADGSLMQYATVKGTIKSIYSILPIRKFYAIGSSSIKLLDILFVVALIGGIAVPIGHISLRILFYPIRSMRRMKKGGK
jgi:hypothetical protein